MPRTKQRTLATALAFVGLAWSATPAHATGSDDEAGKPLVLKLAKVRVKKGDFRPGVGVEGVLPKQAWKAEIGSTSFVFLDLDGDRRIATKGKDGLAIEGHPYVVRLREILLTEKGQCRLSFERGRVSLTPLDVGVAPALVREAAYLTELRIHAGIGPVTIDQEASAHAAAHCEYLKLNGANLASVGLAIHEERPGRPGYTTSGAKAGRESIIAFGATMRGAIGIWYATAYHGATLLDPSLRTVGMATAHGIAILYPRDQNTPAIEPWVHPADGARDVPLGFTPGGEIPNPSPGTNDAKGCGFPVFVRLPKYLRRRDVAQFTLWEPDGERVAGFFSSPAKPGNPKWPSNGGCAFFIPHRPLMPGTTYTARFQFMSEDEARAWSFTTKGK